MPVKYDITSEEMKENILAVYEDAVQCVHCDKGEATRWYTMKGSWIREQSKAYGLDVERAFHIYALLSANSTVLENDASFMRYLRKRRVKHFPDIVSRIAQVRRTGEAPTFKNAAKISSYAENLRFPRRDRVITVDRHSARIAVADAAAAAAILARGSLAGYRLIEGAYATVAEAVGLLGHELQALTWVHVVDGHQEWR